MTSDQPTAQPGSSHLRRLVSGSRFQTIVKVVFTVLVLVFGALYAHAHWQALGDALTGASPGWVVLAALLGVAGQVAMMLGFDVMLRFASPIAVPRIETARAFYVAQLGKYLPGSVWPIVAMATVSRRFQLSARAGAGVLVLSVLVGMVVGGAVGAGLSGAATGTVAGASALAAATLLLTAMLLRPGWLLGLVRRGFGWLRLEPPANLGGRLGPSVTGWPLLAWTLLGLHCWALVVALGGAPGRSLAPAVGGFALAYVAGILFLPAPGGLGVREGVLTLLLSSGRGGAGLPGTDVVALVLISRLLLVLVDFALAGGSVYVAGRYAGRAARGDRHEADHR